MKMRVLLLPLWVGLLAGISPTIQSVQAQQPTQVAQQGWQQFSSPDGGFSVLMPVTPTQKRQTTDGSMMQLDAYHFTASLEEGQVTYSVSYTDFPQEMAEFPPDLLLDSLSSRFTTDRKIKLLNQQDTRLGEYPGKEFNFEAPGETLVKYRAYLVKQRLYQVITEIPKARESALSTDVERFVNSFQLL